MVINPIVGVYIPIIRIPIKGAMTIPNIATFDHGTYRCFLVDLVGWPLFLSLGTVPKGKLVGISSLLSTGSSICNNNSQADLFPVNSLVPFS